MLELMHDPANDLLLLPTLLARHRTLPAGTTFRTLPGCNAHWPVGRPSRLTKKPRSCRELGIRLPANPGSRLLKQLQVGSSSLAPLHDHFIADVLPVVQPLQAGCLDRGDVHEHILPAILRHDEAIALGGVEPLYRTGRH